MSFTIRLWGAADTAKHIRVPSKSDNKYSHGVLGVVTGSKTYPGAAVLGVEAAHRTGIGMVRFLGSKEAANLVLKRRPEVVTVAGTVDAWLIGSGLDSVGLVECQDIISEALESAKPLVLDAGALGLHSKARGLSVITPHEGELQRLVPRLESPDKESDAQWAYRAAGLLGCVVVLKGNTTYIAMPGSGDNESEVLQVTSPTTWLATAGTGDVLAGTIATLVAVANRDHAIDQAELCELAASGVYLHSQAAALATEGGPFPALDVAEILSEQVRLVLGNAC